MTKHYALVKPPAQALILPASQGQAFAARTLVWVVVRLMLAIFIYISCALADLVGQR